MMPKYMPEPEVALSAYQVNSNKSVEIYEEAVSPYQSAGNNHNSKEVITYNDEFSGVYVDKKGKLNIGVVEDVAQQMQSNFRKTYNGQVVYVPQRFSYNYLLEVQEVITSMMTKFSIYTVGIDQEKNRVDVYLTDEKDLKSVIRLMQEKIDYDGSAINFMIDPEGGVAKTANIAHGGEAL